MIASSIKENENLDLTMDILSYFNNDITEFQIDKIIGACVKEKKKVSSKSKKIPTG